MAKNLSTPTTEKLIKPFKNKNENYEHTHTGNLNLKNYFMHLASIYLHHNINFYIIIKAEVGLEIRSAI